MFFNGFTLLLIVLSAIGGFVFGVRVEMYHQLNQREEWLNGATIEDQMKRDGWQL